MCIYYTRKVRIIRVGVVRPCHLLQSSHLIGVHKHTHSIMYVYGCGQGHLLQFSHLTGVHKRDGTYMGLFYVQLQLSL